MDSRESSEGKFNSCYLGKTGHYYKHNYSNDYNCRHEMIGTESCDDTHRWFYARMTTTETHSVV